MTFYVVPLVIVYDILCHMSRRFWRFLLGPLYFAKLSFSEVDGYFLFFLYSAIASARRCSQPALSSKKIYCKEFLRLLFWQRLCLLDWWKSQGVGTNTIGRLHKVMPKNVYAVAIWLTGLIFVELPACGVYTFWYMGLWGVKPRKRPIWTVYELIDDTCDKIESDRCLLLQLLRVCFTPKTAKNQTLSPAADWRAEHLELNYEFLLRWKSAKNTDCNKARMVWIGGAWQDLKLIYDHP